MRKVLWGAGIAAVAVLVAAVTYLTLLDVNQFRPRIQAALQNQLGRPVTLGTMRLRLVPLSIRIAGVAIGEDPAFDTGRQFVTTGEVSVSVRFWPLLRRQVQIDSFVLRQPAIELVRDAAGKWNFAGLGGKQEGGQGTGGTALSIAELRVENGRVAVSELRKRRSVYDHIDIRLTDFAPDRPFRLTLGAALPGAGPESLRLEATGARPLSGFLELRKARIGALRQFLGAGAAGADGTIDGRVDFDLKQSLLSARPRLSVEQVSVGGKDLGRGVRIEGTLQHNLDSGLLSASGLKLAAGGVPVAVSGSVDTRSLKADLTARASGAPVAELLALAAAFGSGGIAGSGRLDLDARVRGPLNRIAALELFGHGRLSDATLSLPSLTEPLQVPSAHLKLSGNTATVEGLVASLAGSTLRGAMTVRDFAAPSAGFNLEVDKLDFGKLQSVIRKQDQPAQAAKTKTSFAAKGTLGAGRLTYNDVVLEQVRAECTYAGDVLTLAPLTARVFGGTQTGALTVDLRSEPAAVSMQTKLDAVEADRLLSATTSLKQALYGLLAASGNASMKLLPGAAAAQSLNADLAIHLTKGRLGGVNLLNEFASLGRFVGFAQSQQPFTDVVGLSGDVRVRDGVARTENLLLQFGGGTVGAAGTVNLVDQSLNLRMTAVFDNETSQRAGGTRIGGYLTLALQNSKGELVIPAIVTGTFAKPRFAPDAARVAEMKLKNVLPAAGNLGAAAKSILGSITSKPTQPAAKEPAGEQPAPRRKGFLGVLDELKKRTEKPPPAETPR